MNDDVLFSLKTGSDSDSEEKTSPPIIQQIEEEPIKKSKSLAPISANNMPPLNLKPTNSVAIVEQTPISMAKVAPEKSEDVESLMPKAEEKKKLTDAEPDEVEIEFVSPSAQI